MLTVCIYTSRVIALLDQLSQSLLSMMTVRDGDTSTPVAQVIRANSICTLDWTLYWRKGRDVISFSDKVLLPRQPTSYTVCCHDNRHLTQFVVMAIASLYSLLPSQAPAYTVCCYHNRQLTQFVTITTASLHSLLSSQPPACTVYCHHNRQYAQFIASMHSLLSACTVYCHPNSQHAQFTAITTASMHSVLPSQPPACTVYWQHAKFVASMHSLFATDSTISFYRNSYLLLVWKFSRYTVVSV